MNIAQYFAKDYTGGAFVLFDGAHLTALGLIVLLNVFLVWRFKGAPESARHNVRWTIAIILWLNEIGWHIWNAATGQWTLQTMLPLHLCSVLVWVGALALVTKNYRVYEFMYFMGIAGAVQALLTPDVGMYGFPHFRAFQTFISHGLIITSPIFMTLVDGYRPTWGSYGRVVIWMNVYMVIVFVINLLIGSNYLFIAHKPPTASILDMLPAWPWYILYVEAIGLIMCLILYVPYIIKDGKHQKIRLETQPS